MKAIFAGDPNKAIDMWHDPDTNMDDFIGFVLANVQLACDDCDDPVVPTISLTGTTLDADTFGPNDGSLGRTANDDLYADNAEAHRWHMEQFFDHVFMAAIQSGLLVEKAAAKALSALENRKQICAARDKVIDAILAEVSSDDAQ